MVRIELMRNKVVISPRAENIPEILALACSVSILYLLCMPFSRDALTTVSPSLYTAGYLSSNLSKNDFPSVANELVDVGDTSCYYTQGLESATGETASGRNGWDGSGSACFGTGASGCVGSDAGGGCVGGDGGGGCVGGDGSGCGAGGECGGCGGGCFID